jgi:hypothetical protein
VVLNETLHQLEPRCRLIGRYRYVLQYLALFPALFGTVLRCRSGNEEMEWKLICPLRGTDLDLLLVQHGLTEMGQDEGKTSYLAKQAKSGDEK